MLSAVGVVRGLLASTAMLFPAAHLRAQTLEATKARLESQPQVQPEQQQAAGQPTAEAAPEASLPESETIVVTARKRNERLLDVPETVTALSSVELSRQGIRSVDDLGRSLPNVVLNRRGDNEPNVVIRGIGAFGNVQGIGFYVDDVQNFTDQASRLVDLERVEVLKGPQGTLYGGSSIGGAVKYVTRRPSNELEGRASVEVGSRSTLNGNASLNMPLDDGLSARVSAYVDSTNGYIRNPVLGKRVDESREYGIRGALQYNGIEGTNILATFRFSDLDNGGNDYLRVNSVRDVRYFSALNLDIYNRRQVYGGILNIQQSLGDDVTLTSLTSYTLRRNRILWDLDYSPADAVSASQRRPVRTRVLTQELRLASDYDGAFNWLVGGYAARTRDRLLVTQADVTLGPDATGDGTTVVIDDFNNSTSLDENYAGFVNLTYETGPLEVTAGARLNYNNFTGDNRNIGQSASFADTRILPKMTLSYRLAPSTLLYASVSKGYEPGKINLTSDSVAAFRPERTTNYEIGLKGETDDRLLSYEVAGFYILNRDRQFETQILNSEGIPVDLTANIGTSRSYGLEGSVTLRPLSGLSFDLNGGYLDSKYRNAVFQLQRYDGNRVPYAPKFSGNVAANYATEVASGFDLNLRVDLSHNSGFFWDIPNQARQPAYNLLGARIGMTSPNGRWELSVRGDNLLDKGYFTEFLYNFAGADPSELSSGVCDACHIARVGQPRTILGTLAFRF